jgi:hypothetical protein
MEPKMSKPTNIQEVDLSAIDPGTLSPEAWEIVKQEAMRRARAERSAVIRRLLRRAWSWLRPRRDRAAPHPLPTGSWTIFLAGRA